MDAWQLGRQIAFLVGAVAWSDAPQARVFATGSAFVSEDEEGNFLNDPPGGLPDDGPAEVSTPFARVEHLGVVPDPKNVGRISSATFRVHVTAGSGGVAGTSPPAGTPENDTHGINQVTGSNRDTTVSFGQGSSSGRDVNEIVGRIQESLDNGFFLDSVHGFQGFVGSWGQHVPADGVQVLTRAFDVVVYSGTVARKYHTARLFKASASGGGSVALSWANPPLRFDSLGGVLRRGTNPGDPAPTTATSGTGIPITGGVFGTSATDAGHSAGQIFNYALFEAAAETPAGLAASTPERYSASVTASVTVT